MSGSGFLLFMLLMLVVMYVLMIRPQRQRQRDQQRMVDGAGVGDDVLTTGGIYGTIVQAEGDDIVVEIADSLSVHMTRRGIAAVLPPEPEEEEEEEEEPAGGEEPVEEEVTGEAEEAPREADTVETRPGSSP